MSQTSKVKQEKLKHRKYLRDECKWEQELASTYRAMKRKSKLEIDSFLASTTPTLAAMPPSPTDIRVFRIEVRHANR